MSVLETGHSYTVLPYYLVVDVSQSMRQTRSGADQRRVIDEVEHWCATLLNLFSQDAASSATVMAEFGLDEDTYEMVRDYLRLSIIEFSSEARVAVPLTSPRERVSWSGLSQDGVLTDYKAAFRMLRRTILDDRARDRHAAWFRPGVIFITDGVPEDHTGLQLYDRWNGSYQALNHMDPDLVPGIVAVGCGGFSKRALQCVGTRSHGGRVFQWQGGQLSHKMVGEIFRSIVRSIRFSVRSETFAFPPAMEGFRCLPPLGY
ncbi:MAG: VWA domain-containing protein [Propionibacteriaceae bacterium]|nr:VWA domain-containing protein [Propionibacteriaceae bacterium]